LTSSPITNGEQQAGRDQWLLGGIDRTDAAILEQVGAVPAPVGLADRGEQPAGMCVPHL
jgi:hypothetical protein